MPKHLLRDTGFQPVLFLLLTLTPFLRAQTTSHFKDDFWPYLLESIPKILATQDKSTGQFGSKPWIVTEQNAIWPLAVAWSTQRKDNPYYHNQDLLTAIERAGDALIAAQDPTGQWTFRKKDGSEWGQIYMPWTYSRWIRAYGIIRDSMSPDRRAKWEKALTLGIEGIIHTELIKPIQNIPATDAAAVYYAGQLFNREGWKTSGADYLHRTAASQDPAGFWSEHVGPVINYNIVYVDALGFYYAKSHDASVLPALQRAARYHAHFTYPDGRMVETVDERNAYELNRGIGGVGFTFTAEGRGLVQQQWDLMLHDHQPLPPDSAASVIAYGVDGPEIPTPRSLASDRFILGNNDAMTARQGPWFACLSAYSAPLSDSRWIQDRQNFISLYHDKVGTLILGGGNTKLQPLWSSFTVGDTSLLSHKLHDENPDFSEPKGLLHVPSKIVLNADSLSLSLTYSDVHCRITSDLSNPNRAIITYALESNSTLPVEAHATFIPNEKLGPWKTASGQTGTLSATLLNLTSDQTGGWFEHNGYRFTVPKGARVQWPVKSHDQYRKDGESELFQARIVLVMPLGTTPSQSQVEVQVP